MVPMVGQRAVGLDPPATHRDHGGPGRGKTWRAQAHLPVAPGARAGPEPRVSYRHLKLPLASESLARSYYHDNGSYPGANELDLRRAARAPSSPRNPADTKRKVLSVAVVGHWHTLSRQTLAGDYMPLKRGVPSNSKLAPEKNATARP